MATGPGGSLRRRWLGQDIRYCVLIILELGDSTDACSADLWQAWQLSVADAANWLRRASGAKNLILGGIRIGAALSTLETARRDDVAGLVLFEPVTRVRSFISQLMIERRLRKNANAKPNVADGGASIEVGELKFSARDIAQMRETDITTLEFAKATPVVIFSKNAEADDASRFQSWLGQGIRLSRYPFEPFEAMLRPNQHSGEPEIDVTVLLDWINREVPCRVTRPSSILPTTASLKSRSWQETIIQFGKNAHINGILCQPDVKTNLAVVIGNSGGNPRHGFARFGVALARGLAEAGIASLRFDFSGLGDSIHLESGVDVQSDVFMQDRTEDFGSAISALEALGMRQIALHGLCSGAFHAMQAACADSRVEALTAINLPWFSLRHEASGPDSTARRSMRTLHERNTRILFMFNTEDSGLKAFERHFGVGGCELAQQPGVRIVISEEIDHELTERWMQEIAIQETIAFLQHRDAVPLGELVCRGGIGF